MIRVHEHDFFLYSSLVVRLVGKVTGGKSA